MALLTALLLPAGRGAAGAVPAPVTAGTGPLTPQLRVAASPLAGAAPLEVTFWGNVTGASGTVQVLWDFGDRASGSGSPVRHTYLRAGTFQANATATESGGAWQGTGQLTISVQPCSACTNPLIVSISPDPSQGSSPLPVSLTVAASGGTAPYSATVCFGDGSCTTLGPNWNGGTATLNHTYALPGTFTIVASLDDAVGASASSTAALSVLNSAPLTLHGGMTPGAGTVPFTASFVAQVSGGSSPYAIQWDFGDGTSGSAVVGVPTAHTYTFAGTFLPTLTVTDAVGHRASYALPAVDVAPAPPSGGNQSGPLAGGWLGAHASTIGAVGLVAVIVLFALLVERRRRLEVARQARELVEAMENEEEAP